uniref:WAP domain-containing protein n=1 Tax=Catagonus wagneri TaxID=51154 RepID=A0A8C3VV25_9CETA
CCSVHCGPLPSAQLSGEWGGERRVPERENSGVCPALGVDPNCRQECLSDGECAHDLKCCQGGCATISLPFPSAHAPYCFFYAEKQVSCSKLDINYRRLSLCMDQCQVNSRCQYLCLGSPGPCFGLILKRTHRTQVFIHKFTTSGCRVE